MSAFSGPGIMKSAWCVSLYVHTAAVWVVYCCGLDCFEEGASRIRGVYSWLYFVTV
jgi:hypothetical protein